MKRRLKLILVSTMILSMLPIQVFAENVNVGVEITNVPTIDVVTTISSNIIVDAQNGLTYPAYINVENNGTASIDIYVTDIEALGEDIPSTFLDFNSEEAMNLYSAGVSDTKTKISFGILNPDGYVSVEPSKTALVGQLHGNVNLGGVALGNLEYENITYNGTFVEGSYNTCIYELNALTGYAWDESKVLNYSITMVVGLAESIDNSSHFVVSEYLGQLDIYAYLSSEDSTKAIIEIGYQQTTDNSMYSINGVIDQNNNYSFLNKIKTETDEYNQVHNYYYIELPDKTENYLTLQITVCPSQIECNESNVEALYKVIKITR